MIKIHSSSRKIEIKDKFAWFYYSIIFSFVLVLISSLISNSQGTGTALLSFLNISSVLMIGAATLYLVLKLSIKKTLTFDEVKSVEVRESGYALYFKLRNGKTRRVENIPFNDRAGILNELEKTGLEFVSP